MGTQYLSKRNRGANEFVLIYLFNFSQGVGQKLIYFPVRDWGLTTGETDKRKLGFYGRPVSFTQYDLSILLNASQLLNLRH